MQIVYCTAYELRSSSLRRVKLTTDVVGTPNVVHIQPQRTHAGVGEHKEKTDQAQFGRSFALFVIFVVKNQATFGTTTDVGSMRSLGDGHRSRSVSKQNRARSELPDLACSEVDVLTKRGEDWRPGCDDGWHHVEAELVNEAALRE